MSDRQWDVPHWRSAPLAIVYALLASLGLCASVFPRSGLEWLWFIVLWICLVSCWWTLLRITSIESQADAPTQPAVAIAGKVIASTASNDATRILQSEAAQFLSLAGHDLRQPMQAIALFSATLAAHDLPEPSQKLVSGIEAAAETLSTQFEEVIAIAKLEGGRVSFNPTSVSMRAMLASSVAAQMSAAHDKDLHLRHVSTSLRAQADETQLANVLDRLIAHALRITETGGVVVGCRRRGDRVRVEVWDSSPGIAAEFEGEVFQPFSKYGQRLPDHALGLALAHRLALRMGGEIALRSRPGKGNVFTLSLPRVTGRNGQ
ncbi:MAG TPA: HAMP domain-containing sensor histidine kinase [Rhodocyclaceae bacterium]|nr:HAMP domain-containing sensor histidine kinase [Rhodocyclaceae bacterium]